MAIVQFTRFKSDNPEEMVKNVKQAKAIFESMGPNIFGFPGSTLAHGPESARSHALFQLGSVRKGAGGGGKGRSLREAASKYATFAELKGRNIAVGVDL